MLPSITALQDFVPHPAELQLVTHFPFSPLKFPPWREILVHLTEDACQNKGSKALLGNGEKQGREQALSTIRKPRLSRWVTFLFSQPWRGSPLFNGVQCSQCSQTCFSICSKLGSSLRNSLCGCDGRKECRCAGSRDPARLQPSESQGMDLAPPWNADGSDRIPASVTGWVGR